MKISQLLLALLLSLLLISEDVADGGATIVPDQVTPIAVPTPAIQATTITIVSSSSIVTVTNTAPNDANGSGDTPNGNNGSGNTTKTLIIAGAVVAGVIIIGGAFMAVIRFRNTRGDFGDDDGEIDLSGNAWDHSINQYHQRI
ncbi:1468_t:CDS:2 [Paraglomus brasilianum]|uniref:1468_t:CDS:1 n=1 Tax=Paraglomus brasilianum TaxID=144538 RepID=A0A9N8YUG4_9GLOM|nr:1468_t:CDS:2 [Paraglomus brasilianum]